MNNIIKLESGKRVEFQGDRNKSIHKGGSLLGKGGQGAVYLVKECDTKCTFALKVYNTPVSNAFVENLRKNIANGAPNDSFVWPLDLTEPMGKSNDRYGYTMELFDYENYTTFAKILKGKTTFPSKEMQIQTLMNLAKAIDALHSRGLCYQDLNDGSVMFDCQNGRILVCDNDNIAPCGINIPFDSEGHCVQGKLKYMAPEVASKILKPDEYSDRFSLAILIFMVLLHAHPFDGVKRLAGPLTVEVQEKIYGTESIFIFHPTNDTNRPDPKIDVNALKAWPTIPEFIQDLFIRTFTNGIPGSEKQLKVLLTERKERPSAKEWCEALETWLDNVKSELIDINTKNEETKSCWKDVIREYIGRELHAEKLCISEEVVFTILRPISDCKGCYLAKDKSNQLVIIDVEGTCVRVRNLNYTPIKELQDNFDEENTTVVDAFLKTIPTRGECIFIEWHDGTEMHCDVIMNEIGIPMLDNFDDLF